MNTIFQRENKMTDNNKKPTLEEIAKRDLNDKFYQTVVGANLGQDVSQYGELGKQGAETTYETLMDGDRVRKMIDDDYQSRLQKGKRLGIIGQPNRLTPYDVSSKIAEMLNNDQAILTLGELEEIVKGVAPDVESIPDVLKGYVPAKLHVKIAEAKEKEKPEDVLSEKEKYALIVYQELSKAYDRGLALMANRTGYFADINATLKQISKKYKPKKKAA